jgi:hypothetical protein
MLWDVLPNLQPGRGTKRASTPALPSPSPPERAPGTFRVPYVLPMDERCVSTHPSEGARIMEVRAPFKPFGRALLWWQSLDRDDESHRSAARKQVKPHLQANVDVCPSFNAGSIWVSRILPPHSAQVRRGTAG